MRPRAGRVPALSQIASMRPNGSGAASSRAGRARASAPASRCPCATGARFASGRLNGAGESGRTRKGRRPAPAPPNETRFPSYGPMGPEAKKRGPPSPAGPSGIRGGAYEKNGELHQYRHPRGYPTRYLHCKGIEKLVCCRWNVPEIAISGVCKTPDGRLAVSPYNGIKRGTPCQGTPLEH